MRWWRMRGRWSRFCCGESENLICVLVRSLNGVNLGGQNGNARTKQWSLSDAGSVMGLDRNAGIEFLCS
jgi:hypothetical protein